MVTELFEERCTVGKAVQVFGERQELLQNGPGDVHPRWLRNNREIFVKITKPTSDCQFPYEINEQINILNLKPQFDFVAK